MRPAGGNGPRAAAVVVQYGPEEPCIRCLESIRRSQGIEAVPVVVDHNPSGSPGLRELVRSSAGVYMADASNPGFSAGANAGIREALFRGRFEVIAVLNADVRVAPDCLAILRDLLRRDPTVGLAGPGLLFDASPDVWWNLGGEILWPGAKPRSWRHGEPRGARVPEVLDTGFVCGSLMAFRPDLVDRVGCLDETYFLYFEDADYSFRVQQAGLRTVVVPEALAWHQEGGSFGSETRLSSYYRARSRLIFSRRWSPRSFAGRISRALFATSGLGRSALRFAFTLEWKALLPAAGVLDYLRSREARRPGV